MRVCKVSLAAAALLCLAMSTARAGVVLDVNMGGDGMLTVGETFTIQVIIEDAFAADATDEILAFGFNNTNTDPSIVGLLGASVAAPFDDDSPLFGGDPEVAGSVFPGLTLADGANVLLATLTFRALAEGSVTIGILSDLSDLNEGLIYFNQNPVDITASITLDIKPRDGGGGPTVPEPATILFMGTGLAGLASLRMRRKASSK